MGDRPIASALPAHMHAARIISRGDGVHRLTFNPVKNIFTDGLKSCGSETKMTPQIACTHFQPTSLI
jgi:hypothetical protein